MRKIKVMKGLKNISMRRKIYIQLNDEVVLPVHTVGAVTLQNALVEYQ